MTNVEVLQDWFATYEREGSGGLLACYDTFATPDYEWSPPISEIGTSYVGQSGYERYWREVEEIFEYLRFEDVEYEEIAPDAVVTRFRVQARGRESGVELDEPCVCINRFRDGRACWVRAWYDADVAQRVIEAILRGEEVPA